MPPFTQFAKRARTPMQRAPSLSDHSIGIPMILISNMRNGRGNGLSRQRGHAYTEEDTNSVNCTSVLGQARVKALQSIGNGSNETSDKDCTMPTIPWSELSGWASMFDSTTGPIRPEYGGFIETTYDVNGGNSTSSVIVNGTDVPSPNLMSRGGFKASFDGVANGTNTTHYYTAMNQLQVLMLTTLSWLISEPYE
ncbi:uncharacterized protein BCR38DRAFT_412977 [Pseudomassariella vexata]|uniref:Uncharacterized protein n=1 Tax=Pseudomassariella vexata TaxID=1141098 RepID=A0A1Y2DJ53_9PEZI|nr:uncharacterized protein BCR38DRAFT_412977 [Pseudomassariella vexata]ORY59278.1 hypothetical protein BCR38DRAFT_412977 [Pseudomassariella vexata]